MAAKLRCCVHSTDDAALTSNDELRLVVQLCLPSVGADTETIHVCSGSA